MQAVLGKTTKNRYKSNPATARNNISSIREKLMIRAGSMAIMGRNREAIYRWL